MVNIKPKQPDHVSVFSTLVYRNVQQLTGFMTPCNSHKSIKCDQYLIWKVFYIA